MEEIEAEAEAAEDSGAYAFLQRVAAHHPASTDGREVIAAMLRNRGNQLKSALLTSLANQVASTAGKDPFAKIKGLIQELIDRLLKEAASETNQKGFCDKATADAEQKRDYAAKQAKEYNTELASLEATRDKLSEEIDVLHKEIDEIE